LCALRDALTPRGHPRTKIAPRVYPLGDDCDIRVCDILRLGSLQLPKIALKDNLGTQSTNDFRYLDQTNKRGGMAKTKKNPKVDAVLGKAKKWQKEMEQLRTIILGCGLAEELKWGWPCYSFQENNVILIHGFKEYVAVLFFKGALLKDPHNILVQQTENVQAARQIRFTNAQEIGKMKTILKVYIEEAVAVEKAGLEVQYKKTSEFKMPDELQKKLDESRALKTAFHALTPGRQRGYLLYFSAPKQPKTREARVEKCKQQILDGKGLND
jgi:uncharacterized protein YdeI (YjbR/CyaY-like superfamily)